MQNDKLKVILDTNIWITFLISRSFKSLDKLVKDELITLIFSEESLTEFVEVANRPKFKKFFSNHDITGLLNLFDTFGIIVNVKSNVNICRDIKDNFLLALAKDSKADFLVTNDNDLLVVKNIGKTEIISLLDFLKLI